MTHAFLSGLYWTAYAVATLTGVAVVLGAAWLLAYGLALLVGLPAIAVHRRWTTYRARRAHRRSGRA